MKRPLLTQMQRTKHARLLQLGWRYDRFLLNVNCRTQCAMVYVADRNMCVVYPDGTMERPDRAGVTVRWHADWYCPREVAEAERQAAEATTNFVHDFISGLRRATRELRAQGLLIVRQQSEAS